MVKPVSLPCVDIDALKQFGIELEQCHADPRLVRMNELKVRITEELSKERVNIRLVTDMKLELVTLYRLYTKNESVRLLVPRGSKKRSV